MMYLMQAQFCLRTCWQTPLYAVHLLWTVARNCWEQQHLVQYSCFCCEHLSTADAFQPHQAKLTKIHIHRATKCMLNNLVAACVAVLYMSCHALHVLSLRKYEVAHKRAHYIYMSK